MKCGGEWEKNFNFFILLVKKFSKNLYISILPFLYWRSLTCIASQKIFFRHYCDYQENKCVHKVPSISLQPSTLHVCAWYIHTFCIDIIDISHRKVMKKLQYPKIQATIERKKNTWSTVKRCFTTYGMWKC